LTVEKKSATFFLLLLLLSFISFGVILSLPFLQFRLPGGSDTPVYFLYARITREDGVSYLLQSDRPLTIAFVTITNTFTSALNMSTPEFLLFTQLVLGFIFNSCGDVRKHAEVSALNGELLCSLFRDLFSRFLNGLPEKLEEEIFGIDLCFSFVKLLCSSLANDFFRDFAFFSFLSILGYKSRRRQKVKNETSEIRYDSGCFAGGLSLFMVSVMAIHLFRPNAKVWTDFWFLFCHFSGNISAFSI